MASVARDQDKATLYLNIRSSDDQRQFLREAQPAFLKVVDPGKSGLLDILYSADLLTGSDLESLSGKDVCTRKEQARKLWFLLNKVRVQDFVRQVSPVLVKEFPHIIPDKFLTQEKIDVTSVTDDDTYCLRHDIRSRIRPATFADLLYHHGCLDLLQYEALASEVKEVDGVWPRLFQSCGQAEDMAQLQHGVQGLLDSHGMHVPHVLRRLLTSGLPCTCGAGDLALPAPSPSPMRKIGSWVRKSLFGWSPPTSSYSMLELRSRGEATGSRGGNSRSLSNGDLTAPHPDSALPARAGHSTGTLSPIGEEGVLSEASPLIHSPSTPGDTPDSGNIIIRPTTNDFENKPGMESIRIDDEEDEDHSAMAADGETICLQMEEIRQPCKSAIPESMCISISDPAGSLDVGKECEDLQRTDESSTTASALIGQPKKAKEVKHNSSEVTIVIDRNKFFGLIVLLFVGIMSSIFFLFLAIHSTGVIAPNHELYNFLESLRQVVLHHEKVINLLADDRRHLHDFMKSMFKIFGLI